MVRRALLSLIAGTKVQMSRRNSDAPSVAINGFGRIGKCLFRKAIAQNVNIVAINQPSIDVKTVAKSLLFDTAHGPFAEGVRLIDNERFCVGGKSVSVFHEENAKHVKWKDVRADYVIDTTGRYTDVKLAQKHIDAGARKVVIGAPSRDAPTFVGGVNFNAYCANMDVVSCSSCTANCAAPLIKTLHDKFGVVNCLMTATHAMTASQHVHDGLTYRSGPGNIVPSTTGAALAVGLVVPGLKGKVLGDASRVPILDVSLLKIYANVENDVSAEAVKDELKRRAVTDLVGFVACVDDKCASSDFIGCQYSAVVDLNQIQVVDKLVTIGAWYDNEAGYSCRVLDLVRHMMGIDRK